MVVEPVKAQNIELPLMVEPIEAQNNIDLSMLVEPIKLPVMVLEPIKLPMMNYGKSFKALLLLTKKLHIMLTITP